MIVVVAIVTAKPGQRNAVLERFQGNVPHVLAEEGCREYIAFTDAPTSLPIQTNLGNDSFVVIEKWDSVDALSRHAVAPHMAAYGADTRDRITAKVIHVLESAP